MDEARKEIAVKTTVKDSVFRNLFQEPKYTLQLYQALHPEDADVSVEDISNVTIENILLDRMYNDCAFTVRNKLLVMAECQTATWSYNIIIRILLQLAKTWRQHINETNQNRYGSKNLSLPEPEFYLLFTGEKEDCPDRISLADEFLSGNRTFIGLKVKIVKGQGNDIVSQYINFTKIYNEQVERYGRTKKAMEETIRICEDRNILREYLSEKKDEVMDMMLSLFDQEAALNAYLYEYGNEREEKGREQGIKQGLAEGRQETVMAMAINMYDIGMPIDKIAQVASVSEEQVKEWLDRQ